MMNELTDGGEHASGEIQIQIKARERGLNQMDERSMALGCSLLYEPLCCSVCLPCGLLPARVCLRPTARSSSSCPQHVGCPSPHKSALPQVSFDPARTCARATHDFYLLARSIICDPQKGSGGPVITTLHTLHKCKRMKH